MTSQGDPYRILGVAPGASLNEIKSAYRRLAKQYHPDAAGERALPRFLAIQAAYERLVDGEGRLRAADRPAPRPGSGGTGGTGEPWRADAGRARASRDAWRARRSGSGGTAGYRPSGDAGSTRPGAGGGTGSTGDSSGAGSTGGRGAAGSTGSTGGAGRAAGSSGRPSGGGDRHHRRGPRKATPGSTTYDEAAETPLDPEWDGGAWYGPTSGTYWTLNPREYADPRKHGPEYLARARRATAGGPVDPGPADAAAARTGAPSGGAEGNGAAPAGAPAGAPRTEGQDERGGWHWTGAGPTTTEGGAAGWAARGWTFETRETGGAAWTPGPEGRPRHGPAAAPPRAAAAEAPPLPDLESLVRLTFPEHLLALARRPDRRWRLLLALVAWPPIGYAIGGLVATATGCAWYSATCPESVPVLLLLVQPLIVAALFAVPPATAVAAFASIAALAMALPAGAILSVGAMPRPVVEPTVLGIIVAATYVVAFGAAAVRLWGGPRRADPGP